MARNREYTIQCVHRRTPHTSPTAGEWRKLTLGATLSVGGEFRGRLSGCPLRLPERTHCPCGPLPLQSDHCSPRGRSKSPSSVSQRYPLINVAIPTHPSESFSTTSQDSDRRRPSVDDSPTPTLSDGFGSLPPAYLSRKTTLDTGGVSLCRLAQSLP